VLLRLEDFEESDDAGVADLLQDVDLLEDFPPTIFIFYICFVDTLNRYIFPGEFVHAERNLAKGSFAEQLDKLVEVKRGVRNLLVLLDICLDVSY